MKFSIKAVLVDRVNINNLLSSESSKAALDAFCKTTGYSIKEDKLGHTYIECIENSVDTNNIMPSMAMIGMVTSFSTVKLQKSFKALLVKEDYIKGIISSGKTFEKMVGDAEQYIYITIKKEKK